MVEPNRILAEECSNSDIAVSQGATELLPNHIPTYTVEITNVCATGCSISGIHLKCGMFSSSTLIDPKIFKRLAVDDCLVNDGQALAPGQIISFNPPGCNTHVGGCGGSTKLMPQIKINSLILNFISTRAFSSYNTRKAIHGRIHYTFAHSVVENTLARKEVQIKETQKSWNLRDLGTKSVFSLPWTYGKCPVDLLALYFLELLKSDLICGERRVSRPLMRGGSDEHLMLGNGLKYLRSTVTRGQRKYPVGFSSLSASGGTDLGGHGRFPSLFSLASSSSSLPSSLAAVGAAADRFSVTELAVDRWTTRRGPLGWCGGPALFHIFWALAAAVDRFLLVIYHV
uniref:Uncharacterized protein n=1 Tax=Fagus sylvatica TaxID=28930 RepID=A0A2N9G2Q0_FAGSY